MSSFEPSSNSASRSLLSPSERSAELLVAWVHQLESNPKKNRDAIFASASGHSYSNNRDYLALSVGVAVSASAYFALSLVPGAAAVAALQFLLVLPAAAGVVPALRGATDSWHSARSGGARPFKAFKALVARARTGLAVYSVPDPTSASIAIAGHARVGAMKLDSAIQARWPGSILHTASSALSSSTARLAYAAFKANESLATWKCGQALRATILDGRAAASLRCYEQTARAYAEILTADDFRRFDPQASDRSAQTARDTFGSPFVHLRDINRLAAAAALSNFIGVDPAFRPEPGLPRLGDMAAPVGRLAADLFGPDHPLVCSAMNRWAADLEAQDLSAYLPPASVEPRPPRPRL